MRGNWIGFFIFVFVELSTLVLPLFLAPRFTPAYDASVVRRPGSNIYWGMVCVAQGVMYCALGLFGHIFSRGYGQILPWIGLAAGFGGGGLWLIVWMLKNKLILSEEGLRFECLLRRAEFVRWRDIEYVGQGWGGYFLDFISIHFKNFRTIRLTTRLEHFEDIEDMILKKGIRFNRVRSD